MKYIVFKCVNYADLFYLKFSAHSSVVLIHHTFSSSSCLSEKVVLYENICTSILTWLVPQEMVHPSPHPSAEHQYVLRTGYANSSCLEVNQKKK